MLNYLRKQLYRYKYVNAPKLKLKKPVDISLELSSYCTNQCGYCYHSDAKALPFTRGKMSKELAYKIIIDAAQLGIHAIKFNYRGEATMNPIFEDIATYAWRQSHGMTFIDRLVNSNFNFKFDREDIFRGLCKMTKVKVSFDSFIPKIFEHQRKGSNYENTLANMRKFYNYPGRNNEMVIQSVRTLLNKDEDLAYEIKKRFPNATVSVRDVVEGRTQKDISSITVRSRDNSERQSCVQAHARLIVHWDGKTVPCCPSITDKLVVGDLSKQTILEVWNSDKVTSLRKSLLNKSAFNDSPCKSCSSYETFKGYRAPWNS
jgi:radical SAM protein with 4Fe4S-binding SPASM domain